jgi:hypothetical protein
MNEFNTSPLVRKFIVNRCMDLSNLSCVLWTPHVLSQLHDTLDSWRTYATNS